MDGELGLTFAAAGLVVHGEAHEVLERLEADVQFRIGGKAQRLLSTGSHEYVHYLQAVGSLFLQELALNQLRSAYGLIRWGTTGKGYLEAFRELLHRLSHPETQGLSCLDILEAGAVLEGYKLQKQDWGIPADSSTALAGFPAALATYRNNPDGRRYHIAFDWLEQELGFEAAYWLFSPLTLIAFNQENPVKAFTDMGRQLGKWRGGRARHLMKLPMARILPIMDIKRPWMANPDLLTALKERLPVTEAAFHIVKVLGLPTALEILAKPWTLDRAQAPQWVKDAVAPLGVVWSSASGLVEMQLSDLASQNERILSRVLSFGAVIGAAERIAVALSGDMAVHRSCPHVRCPHYGPALCHRYYLPPPLTRHHDTCNFISVLNTWNKSSDEIWAEWGLPPPSATPLSPG